LQEEGMLLEIPEPQDDLPEYEGRGIEEPAVQLPELPEADVESLLGVHALPETTDLEDEADQEFQAEPGDISDRQLEAADLQLEPPDNQSPFNEEPRITSIQQVTELQSETNGQPEITDLQLIPIEESAPLEVPSEEEPRRETAGPVLGGLIGILTVILVSGIIGYSLLMNWMSPTSPDASPNSLEASPTSPGASPTATVPTSPSPATSPATIAEDVSCPPVEPTPDSPVLQLTNLRLDAVEQDNSGDYIVGCVTNNTDQAIASISVSYLATASQDAGQSSGGLSTIRFSELGPGQTVPFRSTFTVGSSITDVRIESIFWTRKGAATPQQLSYDINLSRQASSEDS
jgi:hypothetical protein